MSSKGNLGMRRVQTLINNNQNEFITEVAFQAQKVKFSPDDAPTSLVTGDTTFTNADSGKTVLIDASSEGNFTLTLPTAEVGMQFTFMLVSNSNAASEVMIDAGAGVNIRGLSVGVGNAVYVNINSRTVGFADAEKRGAMIELIYTGHWFIRHANSAVALVTSFS